ncbi:gamma-aminobutyric acid receptor subunit alpha-6-like isoform X1 [Montipora capricornis]|uniref:gamma-aminobutyric acid receptor subunit alpha-6-like isoform X1 n=2 Tax=Montipora capricornis TaxID=246305 RepID=UPI0035F1D810
MKMKVFPLTAVLLLSLPRIVSSEDVLTLLFSGYDTATRPNLEEGKPTTIKSTIYIESFGNIEEANMEFKVYSYFRQYWKDLRLAGKLNRTITLKGSEIDSIWAPDPFCYNARESNMMTPNEEIHNFVQIQPDGDIAMSKGVTLLASCVMNLQHFPLDAQTCHLKIGSYAYSTRDIVYEWLPGKVAVGNEELAQFEYKGANLTSDVDVYTTGSFSTITVTFSFQRRIGYYLIQVYFPTIFVVILSWIVFWMEKDDIGNRMALGITTILTIMFLLGSLNGNLPKVSYPKALDWYLLVSFSFVFFSLIECIIVYVFTVQAASKDQQIKCKKCAIPIPKRISVAVKSAIARRKDENTSSQATNMNGDMANQVDDLEMVHVATRSDKTVMEDGSTGNTEKNEVMEKIAFSIDSRSRIFFPSAFIFYNIYYWVYYATA